ncbi:MAG: hypothetical protein MK052_05670 [Alphaproteobacteria bacterium]|nr:hypothetical protein [Alphaproteobacteria bacterium]
MEIAYFWFIASILLFLFEAMGLSGIGLLFAAIAALCVGIMIELGLLDPLNHIAQGAAFFAFTALWAALLWWPIKKLRMGKQLHHHHNMIGRTATVAAAGLTKDITGFATWSGTSMRARLAPDAAIETAPAGTELKIVKVDGSTLILAQIDYPIATDNI